MVQLVDLPEEIIMIILRKLDFWSLHSVYNTCISLRNLVCLHGVIIECNMSMNAMATVNTLKLNFFKDISNHLLDLNMRGVPDLYKTKVLPAFKRLKRLKTLDISYTNLNVLDLIEIHSNCPTLKDITVNFVFGQPAIVQISQETLLQCQSLFEHFENVHLVGSLNNLLSSKLVLYILKKTRLHNLKLSAVEVDNVHTTTMEKYSDCQIPHFNHFAVYLINWKTINTIYEYLDKFPVLSMIELKSYEFFVIYMLNMKVVAVSATLIFQKFFSENFNVTVECVTDYKKNLLGNVAIMIWNKDTTHFDDLFFHKLYRHLKQYFPFFYKSSLVGTSAPQNYDWFYIEPKAPESRRNTIDEDHYQYLKFKRRRNAMPNVVLNYDNEFKEKQKIQLSLVFSTQVIAAPVLKASCDYLRKLTYLSLSGACSYTSDFFNVLFRCCDNLATLNVESPTISPCASSIGRSIALTRSLKNIRIIEKCIIFTNIFSAFSQCQTLENIHLLDYRQWEHCRIADPSVLLEKCVNLYSVFIEAPFAETAQIKQLQLFNIAKTRCGRHNLKVVINQASINNKFKYNYDPFVDPFKLNPIKPI